MNKSTEIHRWRSRVAGSDHPLTGYGKRLLIGAISVFDSMTTRCWRLRSRASTWPVAESRFLAKVEKPFVLFWHQASGGLMAARLVIGLFESKGIAEDACNRLKTEGVPASEIALKVLSAIGPIPSTMEPELEAAFLSPVILSNFRDSFAPYIRNGETIVCVQALTDERGELAVDTLKLYAPLQVGVASPSSDPNAMTIDLR